MEFSINYFSVYYVNKKHIQNMNENLQSQFEKEVIKFIKEFYIFIFYYKFY